MPVMIVVHDSESDTESDEQDGTCIRTSEELPEQEWKPAKDFSNGERLLGEIYDGPFLQSSIASLLPYRKANPVSLASNCLGIARTGSTPGLLKSLQWQ